MTQQEAEDHAEMIRALGFGCEVVRILPSTVDTPTPGDNGWDVEVRVTKELSNTRGSD